MAPRGTIRLHLVIILDSMLPHFGLPKDTSISVNKAMTFDGTFFDILLVFEVRVWTCGGILCVLKRVTLKENEDVTFV